MVIKSAVPQCLETGEKQAGDTTMKNPGKRLP